ncbi:hypothetical protein [Bartonella apis]|uniref:hypothetical protein n=1 Tax=Bartonella apis TaxID=1686310 RepID=UPI0018DD784C|nr:hypothetical protein [Bartonella apis]
MASSVWENKRSAKLPRRRLAERRLDERKLAERRLLGKRLLKENLTDEKLAIGKACLKVWKACLKQENACLNCLRIKLFISALSRRCIFEVAIFILPLR